MAAYRVTGFVSKCVTHDYGRDHYPMIGRITFQCNDYDVASHFARNVPSLPDCNIDVDFETAVQIRNRRIWVDANIRALEDAASELMEVVQLIMKAVSKEMTE